MKNIIVPIDFSEYAENALYVAASIALKENATLHLLHSLGMEDHLLEFSDSNSVADAAPYVKLTEMRFQKFIDKPYLKDIDVKFTIRKSNVFKELEDFAKEVESDLIVMGSKGSHSSSAAEEFFVGSNTQKVVRHSNVPVMVIKNRMLGFEIDKAVFACDFQKENVESYKKAVDFFKVLDVELYLTYINIPDNFKSSVEINRMINGFFRNLPAAYKKTIDDVHIFSDYTVERGIIDYCKEIGAGIISLPTHGRKGLSHIFIGSIGEDIVNHSKYPVVTFKI